MMEKTVLSPWLVEGPATLSQLHIGPEGRLDAPEGKVVLMTVDGVFTDPVPGDYAGQVVLTLADAVNAIGEWENNYRSALYFDGGVDAEKSALSAITGTLTEHTLTGGTVNVKGNVLNGITVLGGEFTAENVKFDHDGNGGDDFQLWGTAVAVWGDSTVTLKNVDIATKGVVTTAVAAAGHSKVVVMDSVIQSTGTDNTGWYAKHPHLSETPWVLGIRGTLRATNVLDAANVTYYNCDCTCNGWGVLSTDGTRDAVHNIINTRARIPEGVGFSSGYGAYILGGVTSTFLGAELEVPDFCFAVGGNNHPITVGSSSRENLEAAGELLAPFKAALGGSFESVPEQPSAISSARFIGMWHHNSTEPFNALPGTIFRAGDTAFLIKSGMPRPNGPEINCDGVLLTAPRIVHLMETDDAGMGVRAHDKCWAPCVECWPAAPAPAPGYDPTQPGEAAAKVNLKNMTVSGDCWNTRVSGGQELCVTLRGTALTGVVSSGTAKHRDFSYGLIKNADGSRTCTDKAGRKYVTEKLDDLLFGKMPVTNYVPKEAEDGGFVYDESDTATYPLDGYGIYYKDPQFVADMDVTASPAVNNGVMLTLLDGSVWTVAGESFLSSLEIGPDCAVKAPEGKTLHVTLNGQEIAPEFGLYTGALRVWAE